MCGIAGSINFPKDISDDLLNSLYHRGPDEQQSISFDNVVLTHTRLAIQDVKHAHQPMHFNEYTLIYNGEIYNHLNLRSGLQEFSFQTNSDTETLLFLLVKYAEKALPMLDGMFAFALYNRSINKILFARDRAGEKPLYIYNDDKRFLFASELNVIHAIYDLKINEEPINDFLRLGFFDNRQTPYQNVQEFPPATYAWLDATTLEMEMHTFWSIEDHYLQTQKIGFDDALGKVDELLHQSVSNRLNNSDLDVGTFLSGGIDSGLVTAMAAQYKERLKTFTVSFDGAYDEAPLAKEVAKFYGTEHTEINLSFNLLQNDLETILGNYGEPFADSSAIPSFYVAKAAKEHIDVILNGDGADELFGGYRRYIPFNNYDFFTTPNALRQITKTVRNLLPLPHQKTSLYNYAYRLIDLASRSGIAQYLNTTTDIFEGYEQHLTHLAPLSSLSDNFSHINSTPLDGLQKLMLMDFQTILSGDLLVKMDIATMAHSLEARSPFLSKELLEFAPSLPSSYKINGKTTKRLLRELAKKYLPDNIVTQPKRGFEVPLKKWVEHDLKETIHDYLKPNCYASHYIDPIWLQQLLKNRLAIPSEKRAKMIWTLLSLEIWHKKVYRG